MTRVSLVSGDYFGFLDLSGGSAGYKVTALVPQTADDDTDGLTANQLRAASTDYPAEIEELYTDVPVGSVGPDMKSLLIVVEGLSPSDNPYDLAKTTESYLRNNDVFKYSTDVTDMDCGTRSKAECFAHFKRGFCQYYASTMAMLMRMEGIPARYVKGFLPGERDAATGQELIRYVNSHAWVEVYFPGYGWYPFDPTGAGSGPADGAADRARPAECEADAGREPRRPRTRGARSTAAARG